MSAAKLAGYDDDQSLVSLGPHAAFGHVLRRAFAFADAISVGLRDDDELRISVHVRHFVLESEIVAPQADAASLHTIEGRIAAILSTSFFFMMTQPALENQCSITWRASELGAW